MHCRLTALSSCGQTAAACHRGAIGMESSMDGTVWSTKATSVMVLPAHRSQARRVSPWHGQAAAAYGRDVRVAVSIFVSRTEKARRIFRAGKHVSTRPPTPCARGRRGFPLRANKELLNSLTGVVSRAFLTAGGDA